MKELVIKGKVYKIKHETIFRRKNLFGKTNSWKSYRLSKGLRWITVGLGPKPILWEKQSKLLRGKFNPNVSGTLFWKRDGCEQTAYIYSFDISKTKFFVIERFPDGREFKLVGKVL